MKCDKNKIENIKKVLTDKSTGNAVDDTFSDLSKAENKDIINFIYDVCHPKDNCSDICYSKLIGKLNRCIAMLSNNVSGSDIEKKNIITVNLDPNNPPLYILRDHIYMEPLKVPFQKAETFSDMINHNNEFMRAYYNRDCKEFVIYYIPEELFKEKEIDPVIYFGNSSEFKNKKKGIAIISRKDQNIQDLYIPVYY